MFAFSSKSKYSSGEGVKLELIKEWFGFWILFAFFNITKELFWCLLDTTHNC